MSRAAALTSPESTRSARVVIRAEPTSERTGDDGAHRSLALEHRSPLLGERAQRLDAILRAEAVLVQPVLEVERLLERQVEPAVDRALRLAERHGRVPRH